MTFAELTMEYKDALLDLNQIAAGEILEQSGNSNLDFSQYEKIISAALTNIGEEWEKGEVSLAQIYMAGIITEKLINEYIPMQMESKNNGQNMAICVLGDNHALGKRMVLSIVRAHGYSIQDFGQGCSVDEIVRKVEEGKITMLLISTLMLSGAKKVRTLRDRLDTAGLNVKIVVGGAPFRLNSQLWQEVGATAKCDTAMDVVGVIERW